MRIMTETEKAYIAGIMDGEGCISIGRNHFDLDIGKGRTPTYKLSVEVGMKLRN